MILGPLTLGKVMLFAILVMGYTPISQANLENTLPYIYYYSDAKGGFITERADGSDSHMLSKFETPDNTMISGPGWSPSGNWFAWTVREVEGGSLSKTIASVINRDGSQFNLFPEENTKGATAQVDMLWSPIKDLLLVNYRYAVYDTNSGNQIESKKEFFVYDPNIQNRVFDLSQAGIFNEWSPLGDHIVTYNIDRSNSQFTIHPIVTNANTINRSFYHANDCSDATLPRWSGDGKLMYVTNDQKSITVEDFVHNKTYLLDLPAGNARLIDWSADGQYALVYTSENCVNKNAILWLVNVSEQNIKQVSKEVQFQIPSRQQRASYGRFENEYNFYSETAWNKNSDYALALSMQNVPYLISSNPFDIDEIVGSQTTKSDVLIWSTINPLQILLDNGNSIESYTIGNNTTKNLLDDTESTYMAMSADGQYLGYLNREAMHVENISTGISITFNLINSHRNPVSNAELYWNFNENWLFATGVISNESTRLIDVLNATGEVHRELGICSITPSCFGWLPSLSN